MCYHSYYFLVLIFQPQASTSRQGDAPEDYQCGDYGKNWQCNPPRIAKLKRRPEQPREERKQEVAREELPQEHAEQDQLPRDQDQPQLPQDQPQIKRDQPDMQMIQKQNLPLYEIYKTQAREAPRFGVTETKYYARLSDELLQTARDIKAEPNDGRVNIITIILEIISSLIERVTRDLNGNDLVQIVMNNPGPEGRLDYPLHLPPVRKPDLTVEFILDQLERVLQSSQAFQLGQGLLFEVTTMVMPVGGYYVPHQINVHNRLKKMSSALVIENTEDSTCLSRAVVLALAYEIQNRIKKTSKATGEKKPSLPSDLLLPGETAVQCSPGPFCKHFWLHYALQTCQKEPKQTKVATRLRRIVGLPDTICGIPELELLQQKLLTGLGIRLVTFSALLYGTVIFSGPEELRRSIYLLHYNNHFAVLTKPTAFFQSSYFCHLCLMAYQRRDNHRCKRTCFRCQKDNDEPCQGALRKCNSCKMSFAGDECYDNHERLQTCSRTRYCAKCSVFLANKEAIKKHRCGYRECFRCKQYIKVGDDERHRCYITLLDSGEVKKHSDEDEEEEEEKEDKEGGLSPKPSFRYVAWDVETTSEFVENEKSMTMTVNCVAAKMVCSLCCEEDEIGECAGCGDRDRDVCFVGTNAMDQFCTWLLNYDGDNAGCGSVPIICFAHNFKAFDAQPLLQWLYKMNVVPNIIMNGCKVLSLELPKHKVKFLDSLNYLAIPLSQIPKAMGLPDNCKKSTFPHLFNKNVHLHKSFPRHPPINYYDLAGHSPEEKKELEEWYKEVQCQRFDFDAELMRYCKNDVSILLQGILAFRRQFMTLTVDSERAKEGIDPFHRSITIASACSKVFRTIFLKPETIGLIPSSGYTPDHKQSRMALEWLCHLNETLTSRRYRPIQHKANGGEIQLEGIGKVDGFQESNNPTLYKSIVYEFHVSFFCLFRVLFSSNFSLKL